MLIEKLLEVIGKDYTDIRLYNLYFTLKFPETKNDDFDKELEYLKKMREKEKGRVKLL